MSCAALQAWARLGLFFVVLVAAGCGGGQGKISGRVLYDGAPLPGGRVTFRPADPAQNSVSAVIDEQGNYEAVLPVGDARGIVDNRELEPRDPGLAGPPMDIVPNLSAEAKRALGGTNSHKPAASAAAKPVASTSRRYVAIPDRYYDIETSNLKFRIEKGEQKRDIELQK